MYTWVQFQLDGVLYGYGVLNRYGLTFGLGYQHRICGQYLGTQNE